MKVIITAKNFGAEAFDTAVRSLWVDKGIENQGLEVIDQIIGLKEKFRVTVSGGHFDNAYKPKVKENPYDYDPESEWNTEDAVLEFENEEDYILFRLQWS